MFRRWKQKSGDSRVQEVGEDSTPETAVERKSFFEAALPVFACGAGLFSDGYINNVSDFIYSPGRRNCFEWKRGAKAK